MAIDVFLNCFWAHRIPEDYVRWIQDFCIKRLATILVNGHTSAPKFFEYAGLPQELPLSSLLVLFFNANLIKSMINKNQCAIAFIDDYTAWVTGDLVESNVTKL